MSKELIERLRGNPFAVRGSDYLEAADAIESLTAERDRLAEAVKLRDDLADTVSKALSRAWSLGQTYFSQADSESYSQNRKATETQAKFNALVDATRDAMTTAPAPAAVPDDVARDATYASAGIRIRLLRDAEHLEEQGYITRAANAREAAAIIKTLADTALAAAQKKDGS